MVQILRIRIGGSVTQKIMIADVTYALCCEDEFGLIGRLQPVELITPENHTEILDSGSTMKMGFIQHAFLVQQWMEVVKYALSTKEYKLTTAQNEGDQETNRRRLTGSPGL